jgi:hypothetical protein
MFERSRPVPLRPLAWDPDEASLAIEEIVCDARDNFHPERFWPSHPQEDGVPDGDTSLYFGAAGVIWALDHLVRIGATATRHDFRPVLPWLMETSRTEFEQRDYFAHGSLLFGDMGTALAVMRLDPSPAIADAAYARADANTSLPIRELMRGMPGSMLACLFMAEMTDQPRWRALYAVQAARLLDELGETPDGPLWVQDLYGRKQSWLGPVHGYAGNMVALLRGWDWLTPAQHATVADAVPRTLAANACRSEGGTNWHPMVLRDRKPILRQHCHGAPSMVTTFADAPFATPEFDNLLREGGELTWNAGPLAKGSNLCHGTGGNGYALLKLYRRTGDAVWLERARHFAMTAIAQCREARAQHGRGRYSLWTGDVGLAIYLRDCVTAQPRFPTVDVL